MSVDADTDTLLGSTPVNISVLVSGEYIVIGMALSGEAEAEAEVEAKQWDCSRAVLSTDVTLLCPGTICDIVMLAICDSEWNARLRRASASSSSSAGDEPIINWRCTVMEDALRVVTGETECSTASMELSMVSAELYETPALTALASTSSLMDCTADALCAVSASPRPATATRLFIHDVTAVADNSSVFVTFARPESSVSVIDCCAAMSTALVLHTGPKNPEAHTQLTEHRASPTEHTPDDHAVPDCACTAMHMPCPEHSSAAAEALAHDFGRRTHRRNEVDKSQTLHASQSLDEVHDDDDNDDKDNGDRHTLLASP